MNYSSFYMNTLVAEALQHNHNINSSLLLKLLKRAKMPMSKLF